ncbi:MAG: acyl-ACP--UDP-N-acetylglucosamine O-acyltransferase [Acidobacteria bacterium]|nr:acyl-ACP--UDP-N-acetylglucosamine O-acyltransferase [Acidobacteriota bacterium]
MTSAIHPTAVVSPEARIGDGTTVGAYAVVGDHVTLGPGCEVMAHASLAGPLEAGRGCRFFPFVSIGTEPQDLKFKGEMTQVVAGDANVFREYVTVNRGTAGGGGVTRIGSGNLFMAYSHVAHDCQVGSGTVFANAATLAGHVTVEDFSTVGAFSGVHQFCRVGRHAFIGGYSVITQDALPFVKSVGNRAEAFGINTVGLERKGFDAAEISSLKRAYRFLLQAGLNTSQALERIEGEIPPCPSVTYLVEFIRTSKRGVIK